MMFMGINVRDWPKVANEYFESKGMATYKPYDIIYALGDVMFSQPAREEPFGRERMKMFGDIARWHSYNQ